MQSTIVSVPLSELAPPTPFPHASVCSSPFTWILEKRTHSLVVEGVGEPVQTTGKRTLVYSEVKCILKESEKKRKFLNSSLGSASAYTLQS
jgi:hypothetical protein